MLVFKTILVYQMNSKKSALENILFKTPRHNLINYPFIHLFLSITRLSESVSDFGVKK
jgi:hypothetical protein